MTWLLSISSAPSSGESRKSKVHYLFSELGTKLFKVFYVFLCIFLCYAKQVTLIVKISSLKWWIPNSIFWKRKNTLKGSYTFLNTLIWANILIRKVLKRSFIMLNTIMENESKSFTNISIFSWGCSFSL